MNSTFVPEWKLQTRESHDGAYNAIPRWMSDDNGERET